jgi:Dienelactone hydrolase and related enzymes
MGGAVDFLLGHEAVRGHSVGAVGFCMGGMLSMVLPPTRATASAP